MSSSSRAIDELARVRIDWTSSTDDRDALPRDWISDCVRERTADPALERDETELERESELD